MPIQLLSAHQFVSTVLATPERGLAYLVGAPIASDEGGGVPGVGGLIDIMREVAAEEDFVEEDAFCDALPPAGDAGEVYRTAMAWWGDEGGGIDRINQIVQRAVMRACRNPEALGNPPVRDGAPDDWYLPKGVRDLAALVCSGAEKFAGPILTTNFDPLLELAIRSAGGRDRSLAIDYRDGSIPDFHPEEHPVVHLHGYWLKSDTLNTAHQLEKDRSKLRRSLERLLRKRRLVVVSYGGWNDVFTRTLIELVQDEGREVDVVWGFYEDDPEEIEKKYTALIEGVRPEIGHRFKVYGGVDARFVFGEMAERVQKKRIERLALAMRGNKEPTPQVEKVSPLTGWTLIDDTFLGSLPELTPTEAVRYFDGAVPTWRHALSDAIPRRAHIGNLIADLDRAAGSGGGASLHLILAASGEGKSTLLLQTAVDVSRREDWHVLARPTPGIPLKTGEVLALDDRLHWLIVSDDAEELVDELEACARTLPDRGKRNVHFLLAARVVDWRWKGQRVRWETLLQYERPEPLRGVTHEDAAALVAAWEHLGDDALGALARVEPEQRVAAFLKAVGVSLKGGEEQGALLGGLLETRYGPEALRAHVGSLLERLQNVPLRGSAKTLYDALVYIAACHCGRGPGLSLPVLADLLGVDPAWVGTEVLRPLGEEAAAVGGAATARTRHPRIAEAVVQEADATFDTDLAEVWAAIVRQTIQTSHDTGGRVERISFNYIAHAGPRLAEDLEMLPDNRRSAIALAAAHASVDAQPERLDAIVDFARTHRALHQPAEGAAFLRANRNAVAGKEDYDQNIRGFWYEWGTCEGEAEHDDAAAWLKGLALSDRPNPAPISDTDIKLSCAGLGVPFGKLAPGGHEVFVHALRAAAVVGMAGLEAEEKKMGRTDHRTRGYFTRYHKQADAFGAPRPDGLAEAVDWLQAGIRASPARLDDAELAGLAAPDAVTFLALRAHLGVAGATAGQASRPLLRGPRPPRR
jgi:hypothetical protein